MACLQPRQQQSPAVKQFAVPSTSRNVSCVRHSANPGGPHFVSPPKQDFLKVMNFILPYWLVSTVGRIRALDSISAAVFKQRLIYIMQKTTALLSDIPHTQRLVSDSPSSCAGGDFSTVSTTPDAPTPARRRGGRPWKRGGKTDFILHAAANQLRGNGQNAAVQRGNAVYVERNNHGRSQLQPVVSGRNSVPAKATAAYTDRQPSQIDHVHVTLVRGNNTTAKLKKSAKLNFDIDGIAAPWKTSSNRRSKPKPRELNSARGYFDQNSEQRTFSVAACHQTSTKSDNSPDHEFIPPCQIVPLCLLVPEAPISVKRAFAEALDPLQDVSRSHLAEDSTRAETFDECTSPNESRCRNRYSWTRRKRWRRTYSRSRDGSKNYGKHASGVRMGHLLDGDLTRCTTEETAVTGEIHGKTHFAARHIGPSKDDETEEDTLTKEEAASIVQTLMDKRMVHLTLKSLEHLDVTAEMPGFLASLENSPFGELGSWLVSFYAGRVAKCTCFGEKFPVYIGDSHGKEVYCKRKGSQMECYNGARFHCTPKNRSTDKIIQVNPCSRRSLGEYHKCLIRTSTTMGESSVKPLASSVISPSPSDPHLFFEGTEGYGSSLGSDSSNHMDKTKSRGKLFPLWQRFKSPATKSKFTAWRWLSSRRAGPSVSHVGKVMPDFLQHCERQQLFLETDPSWSHDEKTDWLLKSNNNPQLSSWSSVCLVLRRSLRGSSTLPAFDSVRLPSVRIRSYFSRVVAGTAAGTATLLLTLALLQRTITITEGLISASFYNIHRLLLTALVVASKAVEDTVFSASYYAEMGGVTRTELIAHESSLLTLLGFRLFVPREEQHKFAVAMCAMWYLSDLMGWSGDDEQRRPSETSSAASNTGAYTTEVSGKPLSPDMMYSMAATLDLTLQWPQQEPWSSEPSHIFSRHHTCIACRVTYFRALRALTYLLLKADSEFVRLPFK